MSTSSMTALRSRRSFSLRMMFVVVSLLAAGLGWYASLAAEQARLAAFVRSLPDDPYQYNVTPYIQAAADVQAMSADKASDKLLAIARMDE